MVRYTAGGSAYSGRRRGGGGERRAEMEGRGGIGTGTHVRLAVRMVERQRVLHNYPHNRVCT